MSEPQQSNTLGKVSLLLGVCASIFVFCTGLCAGVGKEQGWLANAKTLLFVVGATFAFMGAIAALLGFGGLFGRNRSRAAAVAGLLLGVFTVVLFLAIVGAANR